MALVPRLGGDQPRPIAVDEADARLFDGDGLDDPPGTLVRIRPFEETPGLDAGARLLRALHTDVDARSGGVVTGGVGGQRAPTFAWEWWFEGGQLTPHVLAPSVDAVAEPVYSHYPDTSVQAVGRLFPIAHPGQYVAAGRFELAKDCIFPIRHPESAAGVDADPYMTVLPALMGADHDRTLLQVTFRPVSRSWYRRGRLGEGGDGIAAGVKQGRLVGQLRPRVVQSEADSKAASDIGAQAAEPAFQVAVRVLAITDTPVDAIERIETVADAFEAFDNPIAGGDSDPQEFELVPLRGEDVRVEVSQAYRRVCPRRGRLRRALTGPGHVLTADELAMLAHLPNEGINTPAVAWARMQSGPGVPGSAPQFEGDDGTS